MRYPARMPRRSHLSLLVLIALALAALFFFLWLAHAPASAVDPPAEFLLKWGSDVTSDGRFHRPYGITLDSSGNAYVADYYNHRIQKFNSNGSFVAKWGTYGNADGQFSYPSGVAVDVAGNVYVADSGNDRIQKFTSGGVFIAKWGGCCTGDGNLNSPMGVTTDASGNVYVADYYNHRIQKFSSGGEFLAKWGSYGDGDGQFKYPRGVAVDTSGNVYVADAVNDRVQKFASSGTFLSKWGTEGYADGQFNNPYAITLDTAGNVYVADSSNYRVQVFTSSGTFVRKWGACCRGDGQMWLPAGIAVDGWGNVYQTDLWNHRVQKFNSSGAFLGKFGSQLTGEGQVQLPRGIAVAADGYIYVADSFNHRVQKFTPSGAFVLQWGSYGSGNGQFSYPYDVVVDGWGNVYVAEYLNSRIQKFTSSGAFVAKWGNYGSGDGQFSYPEGLALDGLGNVYVADTGNHRVQRFTSSGEFLGKMGSQGTADGQFDGPSRVLVDVSGNIYVTDRGNHRIQKFSPSGSFVAKWGGLGSGDGKFYNPNGLAMDTSGSIYVADTDNHRIQKFMSDGTFLAKRGRFGGENGEFRWPNDVAVDASGNMYVADFDNYRIQKFGPIDADPTPTPSPTPTPITPVNQRTPTPTPTPLPAISDAEWAQIVAAAKAEGTVTCYCWEFSYWQDQWVRDSFKSAYGIDLEIMRFSGTISTARIKSEAAAGKYIADVFNAVLAYHPAMEATGLLKRSDNLPALKDVANPDLWLYSPVLSPYTIESPRNVNYPAANYTYNSNLVPPERLPKTLQDLLDPWWQGKICEIDPITYAGIDSMLWRYWRSLDNPGWWPEFFWQYYNKSSSSRFFYYILGSPDPLLAGDCAIRLQYGGTSAGMLKQLQTSNNAAWVKIGTFEDQPLPVQAGLGQGYSLLATSPHPNAALVFQNWLLSKEGQQSWASQGMGAVMRRDVPSSVEEQYFPAKPVTSYWVPEPDWYGFEGYSYSRKDGIFKLVKEGMTKEAWVQWMTDTSMAYWGQYPPPAAQMRSFPAIVPTATPTPTPTATPSPTPTPTATPSPTVTPTPAPTPTPTPVAGMVVGPSMPIAGFGSNSGFPLYYQDILGTKLGLLPIDPAINLSDPIISGNPYSAALGFGSEAFYYLAEAEGAGFGAGEYSRVEFSVKAGFASNTGEAEVGQETVLNRTRIRLDVPVSGTYTVTTPYHQGANALVFADVVAGKQGPDINFTGDVLGSPRNFTAAATGPVNVFLRPTAPQPAGILGDGVTVSTVTGGPGVLNSVTITGPGGITATTDQWTVAGRILTPEPTPTPTPTSTPKATVVKVASASLAPNETRTLDITALDIPAAGLAGYSISLTYDPAVVRVDGVLGGNSPFDAIPTYAPESPSGTLNITAALAQGPTSGSEVLARLSLTAVGSPGDSSLLDLTINELVSNSLDVIEPSLALDGLVTIGPSVSQSISQALEFVGTQKKIWVTLRAEGGLLSGQVATLEGGIRRVEASLTYDPACMTVLDAKATLPFTTTSATVTAATGTIALTVDIPAGTAAATAPAEFGRLLVRLTGSHASTCDLTLTEATYRSDDGSRTWLASGAVAKAYRRGDARGTGVVTSVTQAIQMLRFLVAPDPNAALANINAVNAASVKSDAPSSGTDNGDHISTADAILILRRIVKIVDDFFKPCTGTCS